MNNRLAASLLSLLALSGCTLAPDDGAAVQVAAVPPPPVEVQILALNDFHGNLQAGSPIDYLDGGETHTAQLGGAARMGATLARLRYGHGSTITVAAGDLIGASPFMSANFLDEPTVMALGEMGLELASVGNHEFDRGVPELRRMQQGGCEKYTSRTPCALDRFAGAQFTYLAGNVVDESNTSLFPATSLHKFGDVEIGFVGLTLKDTASLVAPTATAGYHFLDEVETANASARTLTALGADAVVLLIHEGGYTRPVFNTSGCPGLNGAIVPILAGLDPAIVLVVSGHTHNAYNCAVPMPQGGTRMLTSAGRYGTFVTDIRLDLDPASRAVTGITAINVPIGPGEGSQAEIAALVERYAAAAAPLAAREVGRVTMPGEEPGEGCVDRPQEDLVADAQLYAARTNFDAGVQLSFINGGGSPGRSGGVRADLTSADDGVMTYGEVFAMLPFGNRLQVLDMTGQQIAEALEHQLCEQNFCFSVLVPAAGFSYAIDRTRPAGQRIVNMMLDGAPFDLQRRYTVVVNNFLASGGDGFAAFTQAQSVGDAGMDVDALESWLARGITLPVCGRVGELQAR